MPSSAESRLTLAFLDRGNDEAEHRLAPRDQRSVWRTERLEKLDDPIAVMEPAVDFVAVCAADEVHEGVPGRVPDHDNGPCARRLHERVVRLVEPTAVGQGEVGRFSRRADPCDLEAEPGHLRRLPAFSRSCPTKGSGETQAGRETHARVRVGGR